MWRAKIAAVVLGELDHLVMASGRYEPAAQAVAR